MIIGERTSTAIRWRLAAMSPIAAVVGYILARAYVIIA